MNKLDLFTKTYAALRNRKGIPYWVFTPLRKIVRAHANRVLPGYLSVRCSNNETKQKNLIISFTSFPARINNVWQVVECMLRQTVMPDKIILWLSKEQFPTSDSIPQSLRERESDIFQISMVDHDYRSHKKYYYVSKEYPDSLVFLIDDDIYYPTDIIERSLKARMEHPGAVICNYGYHIGYYPDGTLKPYKQWKMENHMSIDGDLFFGSGGGTLFCPLELHSDLTNIEMARLLTPLADDIWINTMARLANRKIVLLDNGLILPVHNLNNTTLTSKNVAKCENDRQLNAVIEKYGNIFNNVS